MGEIVHLPASARRGHRGAVFLKLLKKVDTRALDGFGFEGAFLRPGAYVGHEKLWPTPDYPKIPILLECAGATGFTLEGAPARGHLRSEVLYILWRLNLKNGEWMEIARAKSDSTAWGVDLCAVAARAIQESAPVVAPADPAVVSDQIVSYLASQLELVSPAERARIVAVLHDEFAARLSG